MPARFSVRIVGLETVQTGMGKFQKSLAPITREAVREAMHRALVATLSGYSRGRASSYVRTGNLLRGTNIVYEGQSARIESSAYAEGSNKDYSGYVLGRGDGTPPGYGQANVHSGYWIPARKAVDDEVERLLSELDSALEQEATRDGL